MFAPRLDGAERSGLKSWSVDDIAEYLQSGRNGQQPCRRTDVGGRGQLDLEDERRGCPRDRGLPEGPSGRRAGAGGHAPPPPAQMAGGEKLYHGACIACHEVDGSGRAADLSAAARQRQSAIGRSLEHAAHHPRRRADRDDAARANKGSMPAYAAKLSDQEIADVATYIRNAWGNAAPAVTRGAGRESAARQKSSCSPLLAVEARISAFPICSGSRAGAASGRARRSARSRPRRLRFRPKAVA